MFASIFITQTVISFIRKFFYKLLKRKSEQLKEDSKDARQLWIINVNLGLWI